VVAANAFSNDAETKIVNVDSILGWQGLDAGPKSLANFEKSNHGIKRYFEWTISFRNGKFC
jgi:hypothetical protein